MTTIHRRQALALATATLALPSTWVQAQTRAPLLMEGKKTLYQRVLTRPGTRLASKPGAADGKPIEPFSQFYVYERKSEAGQNWLLVGAGSDGNTVGYVAEGNTVPWKHSISAAFNVQGGRQRVLFFKERPDLVSFLSAGNAAAESQRLLKEYSDKGTLGAASKVVAAEPDKYVDPKKQFYLLPVLEAESILLPSGAKTSVVKVASVTQEAAQSAGSPGAGGSQAASNAPPPSSDMGITNYNSAVVFVIDATSSMQTYIDRTRKAMEEVMKQAEEAKVLDRMRFGLVGFQDDPAKTKGVEYLSKLFVDPNQGTSNDAFLKGMQSITATKASTRAFAEDSYAALDTALRKIDWLNFGGKYIVFITDASAREGNSPLASTRMSTRQMRTLAQDKQVAIYSLHLKTPEGKNDHAQAAGQYKELSTWPGAGSLYFPVEAGDPARFEADVKTMAKSLVEQVKSPQKLLKSASAAGNGAAPATAAKTGASGAIEGAVESVGRAMVLSYLGRQQGVKSPPMYEAWASDVDVAGGARPFTIRLLMTRTQLSDLQATVRRLAEAYAKGIMKPQTLFDELRSAVVAMGRDPSKMGQGKVRTLEDAGLMGEYLEGLPYRSVLMRTSLSDWASMQVGQQQEIVDNLNACVALYARFYDDAPNWVKLNAAAGDGDRVYPVPFDALP